MLLVDWLEFVGFSLGTFHLTKNSGIFETRKTGLDEPLAFNEHISNFSDFKASVKAMAKSRKMGKR